jgi:uncharacterized protein (TIGR00255 family)
MTGYGQAVKTVKGTEVSTEMRSVNSKSLDISLRLPPMFNDRENGVKEIIKQKISRGKISISLNIDKNIFDKVNLKLEPAAVKSYYKLLNNIKRIVKSDEDIKIDHLLKFSEIFKSQDNSDLNKYWNIVRSVVISALADLCRMKRREGKMLERDISLRIKLLENRLNEISSLSAENLESARKRLGEKVAALISPEYSGSKVDPARIELELVLLADKLDVTEEVVRAKSHLYYFKKNMKEPGLSGRRLGFLVQEINREINTIASKSNNSYISQIVVEMKEELEKVREQLQNAE